MNQIELLKKAKETIDSLVAQKREAEMEISNDVEATKLALILESNQTIVDALRETALTEESIARSVREAIANLKIEVPKIDAPSVQVTVPEINLPNFPDFPQYPAFPEIKLPTINVPEPKVTVNVPEIKLPTINIPETVIHFPDSMDVGLSKFTMKRPMPVIQVDPAGNFVSPTIGGGGGGKSDFFTIKSVQSTIGVVSINPDGNPVAGGGSSSNVSVTDIFGTTGANVINPDGRLKVELPTGSSGLTDTELRASHIDVQQVSGAAFSTNIITTVGLTDTQLRATSIPVEQVSGSNWSTNVLTMPAVVVTGVTNSIAITTLGGDGQSIDPRNRNWTITETVPISSANTLEVLQVSGSSFSTNVLTMPAIVVTSITNSSAVVNLDRDGNPWSPYVFGQGDEATALRVTMAGNAGASVTATQTGTWNINAVTSVTNTIAVLNIDSSGVGYSGSNPMPVTMVTGVSASVNVSLIDSSGIGYSGSNPVPVDDVGRVMTTNPTKVADAGFIETKVDAIGRQVITPIQVRGLMQTAYVSLTTGTEATLFAGVSGVFFDLVSITAVTNSTAGVVAQAPIFIDIRCCRAGGIVHSIPLMSVSGTNTGIASYASKDFNVPLPQDEAGNAWTADMTDITGTTVNVMALFARNT